MSRAKERPTSPRGRPDVATAPPPLPPSPPPSLPPSPPSRHRLRRCHLDSAATATGRSPHQTPPVGEPSLITAGAASVAPVVILHTSPSVRPSPPLISFGSARLALILWIHANGSCVRLSQSTGRLPLSHVGCDDCTIIFSGMGICELSAAAPVGRARSGSLGDFAAPKCWCAAAARAHACTSGVVTLSLWQ